MTLAISPNGTMQAPLRVDIPVPRDIGMRPLLDRFRKAGGIPFLTNLLRAAGLEHGTWEFRIMQQCKVSGHSPRISIVRAEPYAVIIRCHPGDNMTGTMFKMIVGRDKSIGADEVFRRLKDVVTREQENAPVRAEPTHVSGTIDVNDETIDTLLLALATVTAEPIDRQPHDTLRAALLEIGPMQKLDDWQGVARVCVARNFLTMAYVPTEAGLRQIGLHGGEIAEEPAKPAGEIKPSENLVDAVVDMGEGLGKLMQLATAIKKAKYKVDTLKTANEKEQQELLDRHEKERNEMINSQAEKEKLADKELADLTGRLRGADLGPLAEILRLAGHSVQAETTVVS